MCIINYGSFFKILTFFPNTIGSEHNMTCCVSSVSYKLGEVMSNILHTNITVMLGRINVVNIE